MNKKHTTKVAIISNNSLNFSPYISFYSSILEECGKEFIILNKEDSDVEDDDHHHSFKQTKEVLSQNKIRRTLAWYRFLRWELSTNNIETIIVTPTRTAIVLFPFLLFHRGKYIFDIRDYTKENSCIYRFLEKVLLSYAGLVVISSAGFKKWLPKTSTKILCVHNMPYSVKQFVVNNSERDDSEVPIVIGYVGLISYAEQNIALIKAFANDEDFVLQYSGQVDPNNSIIRYVHDNMINNVKFTGKFDNEMKPKIYREISMINAVYGNNSMIVTTALPNKLYDAILYGIPIIASKGTYLGDIVQENGIGIVIDTHEDDLKKTITDYWKNYDRNQFNNNCANLFEKIYKEQQETIEQLTKFFS